ncbi:MAG: homoserine kinase [Caldilineaceae bacterium]|nr:homoserine kinase [Caldilineaceae bacterium]
MEKETILKQADVSAILAHYDLGRLQTVVPLTAGTVQANILLETAQGKFVLRYYKQNRTFAAVCFEVELINYLTRRHYPCPSVVPDCQGNLVGRYNGRPYALFGFVEGVHVEQPTAAQYRQLIEKVAELQRITQHYQPVYVEDRWNYDVPFCERMATEIATRLATPNADAKLAWYRQTLATLDLPDTHPKGVCHCDFHFSNVLFKDGNFHALLDFDDANYTYLTFDLIALLESSLFRFRWDSWQTVQPGDDVFDFAEAKEIITIYQTVRPLRAVEKHHLFIVLKLATLIDCLWFFERGAAENFYERRKIDCLDALGRAAFTQHLFATNESPGR